MYTAKYNVQNTRTPCGRVGQRTTLRAKFRFGSEVPKCQREEVLKRLTLLYSGGRNSPNVHDYLQNHKDRGMRPSENYIFLLFGEGCSLRGEKNGKKWEIIIQPPIWPWDSLSLNISGDGEGQIPLEDMLDLEGLNRFILTGKSENKEE